MQISAFLTSRAHVCFQQIREVKAGPLMICSPLNVQPTKMANIASLVTDSALVVIMIVGLRRLGYHREGSLAMGRFLWKQVGSMPFFLIALL